MDTNLVSLLIALQNHSPAPNNSLMVMTMVIAAIAPTLASIAAYISSRAAKEDTKEAKATAMSTADAVEKIHVAVNSERTATLAKLDQLSAEILRISKDNAAMAEAARQTKPLTPAP